MAPPPAVRSIPAQGTHSLPRGHSPCSGDTLPAQSQMHPPSEGEAHLQTHHAVPELLPCPTITPSGGKKRQHPGLAQ